MNEFISVGGNKIPYLSYNALVVGAGAAGLCAAHELALSGVDKVAVITENARGGTSRNAGSDKQTFYKLTTAGAVPDSVYDLAQTLFSGGSMHGDTALAVAAGSLRAFYKLVLLGVPFPENEYGEHVGYRTDHDERRRATSCGPLTSKFMAEALEKAVIEKNVPILDGFYAVDIITRENNAVGVLCACEKLICDENPAGLAVIGAGSVVWAVGGPSDIYFSSVYPESQGCSFGAPLRAGAEAVNLTESQYGIASTDFRWNLSGSYQQVMPRYVSIDENGNEREFLCDYFSDGEIFEKTFKKGYEWPFDAAKIPGSSQIDLAVIAEEEKGRRVYLDYTENPCGYDESLLTEEVHSYLSSSCALGETPLKRLEKLNMKAVELFKSNGIDLSKQFLKISVCAQHLNGGFDTDINGESTNIGNLYFVGECAGNYGVKRPGGSALLAGQVMAFRAAKNIAERNTSAEKIRPCDIENSSDIFKYKSGDTGICELLKYSLEYGKTLSAAGALLRSGKNIEAAKASVKAELDGYFEKIRLSSPGLAAYAEKNRDVLITQYAFLCAISDYISDGGKSRGGYAVTDKSAGELAEAKEKTEVDTLHSDFVQKTVLDGDEFVSEFIPVRPIPQSEQWFEKVYK